MYKYPPASTCWSVVAALSLTLLAVVTGAAQVQASETPAALIETHTESKRSLLGGFWTHSTSTKTIATPRIVSLDEVSTGSLLFKTEQTSRYIEAPRVDTKVSISVTGMLARVSVVQSFTNPSSGWYEGIYAFPLPEDSAVDALRMRVGDTVIDGEIMEKATARRAYDRAKREGTRASLVEQARPNIFQTSVANIAPRDTVEIEISYLETLRYDHGAFSLRYPLAITPRYSPSSLSAGMLASTDPLDVPVAAPALQQSLAEITVALNAGFPLKTLLSDSHDVVVDKQETMHYVRLRDVAVPMDRDFELRFRPDIGAQPGAAIFTEQLEGSTYATVMFMPPQASSESVALPRETIIVVDTSGSMAGASFEQAIQAVHTALDLLRAGDYFNIVQFNNGHSSAFGRPVPATAAYLKRGRRFLSSLVAGGGTHMGPPLAEALMRHSGAELLKQVVFITDGAVDNEKELFTLIHDELGQTRLFTVGIGAAPNSYFMRKAAETGRGTYTYISSAQQVGSRMQNLFEKLESPVLKDIKVLWSGSHADMTPSRIQDLYLTEPLVVSAKLDGQAATVKVSAEQAGRSWSRELTLGDGLDFRGVSTLWARGKVGALMDGLVRGESPQSVRAQVVPLALRHHLVTRYTSLVALDDRPARPETDAIEQAASPSSGLQGVTQLQYPATATNARQKLVIGLVMLLVSMCLRRVTRQ